MMKYRNSNKKEINLVAKFLALDTANASSEVYIEQSKEDQLESYILARKYFYSTLETNFNYKIVTVLSFIECEDENACDIFQSRFIIFPDDKVQGILDCDWLSKDQTEKSLIEEKKLGHLFCALNNNQGIC